MIYYQNNFPFSAVCVDLKKNHFLENAKEVKNAKMYCYWQGDNASYHNVNAGQEINIIIGSCFEICLYRFAYQLQSTLVLSFISSLKKYDKRQIVKLVSVWACKNGL